MIASELLLPTSQWLGWLLYAAVLGWALWRSPWLDLDNGELRGQRQFTDAGALRQALQALGQ